MDFGMSWIGLGWGFGGVYGFFLFFSFLFLSFLFSFLFSLFFFFFLFYLCIYYYFLYFMMGYGEGGERRGGSSAGGGAHRGTCGHCGLSAGTNRGLGKRRGVYIPMMEGLVGSGINDK